MNLGADSIFHMRETEVPIRCTICHKRGHTTTYLVAGVSYWSDRPQLPDAGPDAVRVWHYRHPRGGPMSGVIKGGPLLEVGPIRGSISSSELQPTRPRNAGPSQLLRTEDGREFIEFGECRSSTCQHVPKPMLEADLIVGLEKALRYPPRGVVAFYV